MKIFVIIIATINLIVVVHTFEKMYCGIFEYLIIASFKDEGLFGFFFTYVCIIETNDWGMLYLYYVVQLCDVFYII